LKPQVESALFQRLMLNYDAVLSCSAFSFNLRHYFTGVTVVANLAVAVAAGGAATRDSTVRFNPKLMCFQTPRSHIT